MLPTDRRGEPLRVFWLIDSLTLGGAERLTVAFARAADPARVALTVCALKRIGGNPYENELRSAGVNVVHLGSGGLRDVRAFVRLVRLARAVRPALVHAHLTDACIWGAPLSRILRVPLIATLHVQPTGAAARSAVGLRERLMCLALRWSRARVLAVSEAQRREFVAAGLLPPERVAVVHNGVAMPSLAPEARERARGELGIAPDECVAMTVAALRGDEKGIDVLLRAMPAIAARVPHARVVIVGGGPGEQRFRALAHELGVDGRVVFTGYRSDAAQLLAAADLFVLPSRRDAFPTAILEAMGAGLPVVATDVGGVPEIVADGATGALVPSDDAEALAGAVSTLLTDPRRRAALGAAGRERAMQRFSIDAWLARLDRVYADALGVSGTTATLACSPT